jgi:multicomponent Na+:H+ antiporter subunit E
MKTFSIHTVVALLGVNIYFNYLNVYLPYNATTTFLFFLAIFFILWLSSRFYNRRYFRKLPKAVSFFFYFIKEMLLANLKIAFDILTPHFRMTPIVIALPLSVRSNLEITLLVVIISLTPGTLSIDVDENAHLLYIHSLYLDDHNVEKLKRSIKNGFERRLLELTR